MDKTGEKISLARKARGWSQEKLAEEAGVNTRTIQRIEKGLTNSYGETLSRISRALNIPTEELVNYGASHNVGYIKAMHYAALIFVVVPLGNIFLPLIFWLLRKNDIINISFFARKLLNFELTWSIIFWFPYLWKYLCVLFNLNIAIIPPFLSPWTTLVVHITFLYLLNIIYLIIVGALISEKPKNYFPIAIPFIK